MMRVEGRPSAVASLVPAPDAKQHELDGVLSSDPEQ